MNSSDGQASMARSKFMLRFRISCTRVNKCVHVYRTIKSDTAEISVFYSLQTLTFTKNQLQNWSMRGTRCKSGHAHTRVTQKQYHTCKRNFRVFGRRDLFPHSFPIPPHTSSRVYSSSIIGLCDLE